MKTTIKSNGTEIDIQLEAENQLEQAITNSVDLFKQATIVSRPEDGILNIHINTSGYESR